MQFKVIRTDLASQNIKKQRYLYNYNNIKVYSDERNSIRIIKFNILNNKVKDILKKELILFLNKIKNKKHVLVVGLGNENYTADATGPKVIKNIKVNSYLGNNFNYLGLKISALEPGILGQTGIDTQRIIKAVVREINCDFLIVVDSFVSNKIEDIEKTIEISNQGITPGSGIMAINSKIDKRTVGIPVIVIGVPTALEINIKNSNYILASNSIDKYIVDISKIISDVLNEILYFS